MFQKLAFNFFLHGVILLNTILFEKLKQLHWKFMS